MARISNERRHAEALLRMLETPHTKLCLPCPHSDTDFNCGTLGILKTCAQCRKFIGLSPLTRCPCPCSTLTQPIAVKRTWIALDEKGYL